MNLSLDELITVRLALDVSIGKIKATFAPSEYAFTSLTKLEELKVKVDREVLRQCPPVSTASLRNSH